MKAHHLAAHAAQSEARRPAPSPVSHTRSPIGRAALVAAPRIETLEGRRLLNGDLPADPPDDPPAPAWVDVAELIRLDEWVAMQEPDVLPSQGPNDDGGGEDTSGQPEGVTGDDGTGDGSSGDGSDGDGTGGTGPVGGDDPGGDGGDDPVDDPAPPSVPVILGAGHAVAIIDSGIDYMHPDLGGGFGEGFKVVGGWDFVDDDADPLDTNGHGTAVAGIIGADEFMVDGRKMRGIAPQADLIALRVNGDDEPVTAARMEEALQWVLANREAFNISAVNLSLGAGHFNQAHSDSRYGDELTALAEAGVLVVAASGNSGIADGAGNVNPGIDFPAAHPDVLSVGGVDRFGVIPDSVERGDLLDVLAPSVDVPSLAVGGGYALVNGTSFATPFLAGLFPLFKQLDPAAGVDDFHSLIRAAGDRNVDGDDEFGPTTGLEFAQLDMFDLLTTANLRAAGDQALLEPEIGKFGNENDLVVDDAGVLHYAWFDSGLRTLRYATQSVSGMWSTPVQIDDVTPEQGHYVSLALDSFGRPSIAYYDGLNGDLKFASMRDGTWSSETLEFKGSTGLYPSLVFEADDTAAISYYRKQDGDLRLFRRPADGPDAGTWVGTIIDEENDTGRSGDLEITPDGTLAIAYDHSTTGQLRIAEELSDGAWQITIVDPDTIGGVAFIDLEYHGDRPHISYYDAHPADLKFAERADGLWSTTRLQSKGPVGLYTQLHFDADGMANILFYDRRQDRLDLATEKPDGSFGRVAVAETAGRYIATTVFGDTLLFTYRDTDTTRVLIDEMPLA